MAYNDAQRKARDLDAVRSSTSLEAKLATNTYHVGSASHIRALWPASIAGQPDMSRTSLWWICPAKVYGYDAPLMGRGKVTVNWENCIKCESCWRSEPDRALWGRFTDHGLIYRPESGAMAGLLGSLKQSVRAQEPAKPAPVVDQQLWYLSGTVAGAVARVVNAAAAFRDSLDRLPASPDAGRCSWPRALGIRLIEKMTDLEALLRADERPDAAAGSPTRGPGSSSGLTKAGCSVAATRSRGLRTCCARGARTPIPRDRVDALIPPWKGQVCRTTTCSSFLRTASSSGGKRSPCRGNGRRCSDNSCEITTRPRFPPSARFRPSARHWA